MCVCICLGVCVSTTHPVHGGDGEVEAGGSLVPVQSHGRTDLARLLGDGEVRGRRAPHPGTQRVGDGPKGTAVGVGSGNLDDTNKTNKTRDERIH